MSNPSLVIEQLVAYIRHFSQVQRVILFGSRARGNHRAYADIDIAIEGQINDTEKSAIMLLADVEDDRIMTLFKIDIVFLAHAGDALQQTIYREGVVLYERH